MDDQPVPLWPAGPNENSTLPDEARPTSRARSRGRWPWVTAAAVGAVGMVVGGVLSATLVTAGSSEDEQASQVGGQTGQTVQPPAGRSTEHEQRSEPAAERHASSEEAD